MPLRLPLEVIQLIILYIPFTRLRLLCEEDDSLKSLIAPILYKYVSIGDFMGHYVWRPNFTATTKFHNITILELTQLVSGEIDVKVHHLHIKEASFDSDYFKKIWKIVRESREFFSKIPIIDYMGCHFDMCMKLLPVQNLRQMAGDFNGCDPDYYQMDAFPPNITDFFIRFWDVFNVPYLPQSLKNLILFSYQDANLVFEFPPYLELLTIWRITFSDKLPEGLLKLNIKNVYNVTLPDSLVELEVEEVDALIKLPPGLKKLKLKSTDSLGEMTFPHRLEVLDLINVDLTTLEGIMFPNLLRELRFHGNKLESLDNVLFPSLLRELRFHGNKLESLDNVLFPSLLRELRFHGNKLESLDNVLFPSLLRELRFHGNKLESLDNVLFPNLTLLDNSYNSEIFHLRNTAHYVIKSLSRVQFPNLECLLAYGHPVEDWSVTNLPGTLKELEMCVMEEPRMLKFPPYLKMLKICFRDELAAYSDLQLPDTIEELHLERGVSSIFEWNLPQLRIMNITFFNGPIKVPESVVDLTLDYYNFLARDIIQLPPNVVKLTVPYALEEYPATVIHLKIIDCDVESFVLPPNVESVDIQDRTFDGSLFTPPSSFNYLHGKFGGDLNKPSNWDIDNEVFGLTKGRLARG